MSNRGRCIGRLIRLHTEQSVNEAWNTGCSLVASSKLDHFLRIVGDLVLELTVRGGARGNGIVEIGEESCSEMG